MKFGQAPSLEGAAVRKAGLVPRKTSSYTGMTAFDGLDSKRVAVAQQVLVPIVPLRARRAV